MREAVSDILAYNDPLGTRPPRIKVQVKRQQQKVAVDGVRSFMAVLGQDDVGIEAIAERVKQAIAARDDKSVFLRMDSTVTAQDIMTVTDRLKEAGVEKVGFMTQPGVK